MHSHSLALAWSLWTELGAPGPHRRHQHVVIDPEALIVYTPWLARDDIRLADLVFSWCTQHHNRIFGTRLTRFLGNVDPDVREPADAFFADLARSGVPWSRRPPTPPLRPRESRKIDLPMDRSGLWRFRLRTVAGVGGRAEVMAAMATNPKMWVDASSLSHVGISKRNVARVLADFAQAGVVRVRPKLNALEFQLRAPRALTELMDSPPTSFFPTGQHYSG